MAVERKLLVREGERQREVLLVGTVTVGRSPLCEISGVDPRLSREHAAFEVVGADVVVRDLGSRNGTLVNGAAVTSHRLIAGDVVEVGPFTVELTESAGSAAGRPAAPRAGNEDATVLRPIRAERPAGASHPVPAAAAAPTASAAAAESTPPRMAAPARPVPAGDEPTVRRPRPSMPAAPGSAPAPSVRPQPVPAPPPSPALPGAPVLAPPRAATPPAALSELSYGRAALLWVVPVALVAFLAGLVPALLAPDERGPLLEAHYGALATSAAELTKLASEPAMPLDAITAALRRHAGVTSVRILGADGRVHAPMNEAGTKLEVPALSGATPHVDTAASGQVAIHVAATTRDGRPLIVALAVDPSAVAPAPSGSALGTLLLFASLGLAWLVARRLTRITDGRLSRLGEEVELMTTGQVAEGRDPFGLHGGRRILDAATFALSSRRVADSAPPPSRQPAPAVVVGAGDSATIEADAGYRVTGADGACAALLGVDPGTARGQHLIDVLGDRHVADEVLRLVAAAGQVPEARGEAAPEGREFRVAIVVTRSGGAVPLTIRFTKV